MAETRPVNDYVLGPFLIANLSSASQSQKIPVPMKGQVVGISLVAVSEISVAVGDLTVRKNGSDMTGVVLVYPIAAAGTVTTKEIPATLPAGYVDEGDEIDIDTDGDSTGASIGTVMVRIRR
jgi:hypothetical protein